jgi:glycosyltransferase involved in cell wall biosynthesis
MRVIVAANGLGNGGAERVSSILASELSKRGHDVMFMALYFDEKLYKLDADCTYKCVKDDSTGRIFKYIRRARNIRRAIREFKPDYIISFAPHEIFLNLFLGEVKLISSERGDPSKNRMFDKLAKKIVYRRSENVVFQVPDARDYFAKSIRKKGVIIPNPMGDGLPFWDADCHEKTIVTACRMNPQKNLEMLVRAFGIFRQSHGEYRLKIYGAATDVDYFEKLKEYTEERGLDDFVEFCGFSRNVHEQEVKGEIFVLTSNFEGLSNSMLEALCMGIPSICTDCPVGGAAQYIQDGVNGFLVGLDDSDTLAARMAELADNSELEVRFHAESIKLREKLDKKNIIDMWERLLV